MRAFSRLPMKPAMVVLARLSGLIGCQESGDPKYSTKSGADDSSRKATTYDGIYGGPLNIWKTEFLATQFSMNQYADESSTTATTSILGNFTAIQQGFLKLTVTSATGVGAPATGAVTYAVNVPGYVLFLKPFSTLSTTQLMPSVSQGSCPTSSLSLNWIHLLAADGIYDSAVNWGTARWNVPGHTFERLTGLTWYPESNGGVGNPMGGNCKNGLTAATATARAWSSPAGGVVAQEINGQYNSTYLGIRKDETATLPRLADDYTALVYSGANSTVKPYRIQNKGERLGNHDFSRTQISARLPVPQFTFHCSLTATVTLQAASIASRCDARPTYPQTAPRKNSWSVSRVTRPIQPSCRI